MKLFLDKFKPLFNTPGEGSAGGGGAAPADTGGSPAAGEPGGGPSVAEIMQFDPFAPPSSEAGVTTPDGSVEPKTSPADANAPGGAKPQVAAKPPAAPGATPATAVPATPAVPTPAPNLEQLFREQTALIRQAVERPVPAAPTTPAEPEKPRFNLAIPPQILAGMRSEDPNEFATSMHSVINGIANHLWGEFNKHLETTVQPSYRNMIQEQIQGIQSQQAVAQDFYGKHSSLNAPALKPIVQQAGVAVAQARMAAGKSLAWSEELRDEIAEYIYTSLPQLRPAVAGNPPVPPPAPGSKPRFVPGGSARPAAPSGAEEQFGADLLVG